MPARADEPDKMAPPRSATTAQQHEHKSHAASDDDSQTGCNTPILIVSSNPDTFEVSVEMVQFFLQHNEWIDADTGRKIRVQFHPLPGGRSGNVIGSLAVISPGKLNRKLLKTISSRLETIFSNLAQAASVGPFCEVVESARKWSMRTSRQLHETAVDLRSFRHNLLTEGIVPDKLDEQMAAIERERFTLKVEYEGLQVRRNMLMLRIARSGKKMKKAKEEASKILGRLDAVVDNHARNLKSVLESYKQGIGSHAGVNKAEAELLIVQADLEQRRQSIVEECGGGLLESLNERAVETETELQSINARLGVIDKRMKKLLRPDTIKQIEHYHSMARSFAEAERMRQVAADEYAQLDSQRLRMQLPRVKIICHDELLKVSPQSRKVELPKAPSTKSKNHR